MKGLRKITPLLAQIGTLENAIRLDIDIVGVVPVAYVPNADQKAFMAGSRESQEDYLCLAKYVTERVQAGMQ